MRNIWSFWNRRPPTQRKLALQPIRACNRAARIQSDFGYRLSFDRFSTWLSVRRIKKKTSVMPQGHDATIDGNY
jgi:hypothetical protein